MAVVELGVEAALRQQGVVVALLHDVAVLHDEDDVGLADGGQAVGHDEARAALHHPGKGRLDAHFRAGIDGGSCLVQDQHRGQTEHHAGDAEQLLLALTDVAAVLSNNGIVTLGQAADEAVGVGGLALSGKEHAVVVSMGTGTSFLWANKGGEIRHLIGSGVGGGTLAGLSSLTTGVHQYALIRKLCQDGDLSHIDLTMADLSREQVGDLPPEATAANFAKVADDATPSDKMLGIVNLVLQSIGTMSVLACKCCGTDTVVLTGALTMLPPARETFELFKQLYHVNFIIPENATFATAIGAALYSVREN